MGSAASKPAREAVVMSAAAVQARKQAAIRAAVEAQQEAAAARAAAGGEGPTPSQPPPPSGVVIEGTTGNITTTTAAPSPSSSRQGLLETDDALIKVMNELGPAIKTMRLETPRKDMNKMVRAHEEIAHTVPEQTLVQILKSRRECPQTFNLTEVCKEHDLQPDEIEKALKVIQVPRIVEKLGGQKYGYWN